MVFSTRPCFGPSKGGDLHIIYPLKCCLISALVLSLNSVMVLRHQYTEYWLEYDFALGDRAFSPNT